MQNTKYAQLVLSCGSRQEASRISGHLLDRGLVAATECLELRPRFTTSDGGAAEIRLVMESLQDYVEIIESEIKRLRGTKAVAMQSMSIPGFSLASAD